jgi:energy-coupling factor transporter ATP-binding protein EcfA2
VDLHEEIWNWAQGLPPWQSDLLRRCFSRGSFDNAELNEIFLLVLEAHGLCDPTNTAPPPIIVQSTDILVTASVGQSHRVVALADFKNVCAVQKDQRLEFSPEGITIVYGDNAVGKSSYARVLKQACRAVDSQVRISPNVFESGSIEKATAKIEIEHKGFHSILTRDINTPPIPELSSLSIFDSECARIYAESENAIAYIPSDLEIFDRLAKAQAKLRDSIQEDLNEIRQRTPRFLEFSDKTRVRDLLDTLSETTDISEINRLAKVSDSDWADLSALERDLSSMIATDPRKIAADLNRKANEAADLLMALEGIATAMSPNKIDAIIAADRLFIVKTEAANLASKDAFTGEPVKGVGSEAWRTLWEAARKYSDSDAYPDESFPLVVEGVRCVLCHQSLGQAAKLRFKRFQEFVLNTVAAEREKAENQRKKLLQLLDDISFEKVDMMPIRKLFVDELSGFETQIAEFLSQARRCQQTLRDACDAHDYEAVSALPAAAFPSLREWITNQRQTAIGKERLADPHQQAKILKDVNELKARFSLAKRLKDVLAVVQDKARERVLVKAQKALSTQSITAKLNELMDSFVTDALRKGIHSELRAFGFEHLRVRMNSRGIKGKTHVRFALETSETTRVEDVFSEGERKALSLAFFLAEIGSASHDGGIILDDPVTSLDHSCRGHVAKRLIEEARRRQVLVFTHDIVFLMELQQYAKDAGLTPALTTIRRSGDSIGLISKDLPWIAQDLKARRGVLRARLQTLSALEGSSDPDEYRMQVKLWYQLLREAWERAVEELLFQGVVQRFTRGVQTQRLKHVKVTDELLRDIDIGMTKSSSWVHDQAVGQNPPLPNMAELDRDLEALSNFITKCPKK